MTKGARIGIQLNAILEFGSCRPLVAPWVTLGINTTIFFKIFFGQHFPEHCPMLVVVHCICVRPQTGLHSAQLHVVGKCLPSIWSYSTIFNGFFSGFLHAIDSGALLEPEKPNPGSIGQHTASQWTFFLASPRNSPFSTPQNIKSSLFGHLFADLDHPFDHNQLYSTRGFVFGPSRARLITYHFKPNNSSFKCINFYGIWRFWALLVIKSTGKWLLLCPKRALQLSLDRTAAPDR